MKKIFASVLYVFVIVVLFFVQRVAALYFPEYLAYIIMAAGQFINTWVFLFLMDGERGSGKRNQIR
jgi:hypothetical protein